MQLRYVILALLLATPAAAATWNIKGTVQPNTQYNAQHGMMWADPDTTPVSQGVHKVYFSAVEGNNLPPNEPTPFSPNFATLGLDMQQSPYQAYAFLGVWKDCNKDGYVGLADNALFEYRSTLLLDTSVCPSQAAPTIPNDAIVHNDGTWVHEFIPIGYDQYHAGTSTCKCTDTNLFKVDDAAARVWGDNGLPGAPGGQICWINPTPPGSLHTVGQIESTADCYSGFAIASTTGYGPASVQALHNPWGEPSDGSDATVFDCSQPAVASSGPIAQENNYQVSLYHPKVPPTVTPPPATTGNLGIGGTLNETGNGLDDCDRTDDGNGAKASSNEWEAQADNAMYSHESYHVTTQDAGHKNQNNNQFKFYQGSRGATDGAAVGPTGATDAGHESAYAIGFWQTNSVCTTCNQFAGGANRNSPTLTFAVQHQSFYAYVSPTAISTYGLWLPGGTPGSAPPMQTYGQDACQGATTGTVNGWECDPNTWYLALDGTDSAFRDALLGPGPDGQGVEMGQRVGAAYDLIDVECYDFAGHNPVNQQTHGDTVSWSKVGGQAC